MQKFMIVKKEWERESASDVEIIQCQKLQIKSWHYNKVEIIHIWLIIWRKLQKRRVPQSTHEASTHHTSPPQLRQTGAGPGHVTRDTCTLGLWLSAHGQGTSRVQSL